MVATLGLRPTQEDAVSGFQTHSCVGIQSFDFTDSSCVGESGVVFWSDIFSESVPLPSPHASESAVFSSSGVKFSSGLIAGIICGFLFLIFSIFGGYFLIKRICQTCCGDLKSDSAFDTCDIGFLDSTLTETLVPLTDSITIEGTQADSFDSQSSSVWDVPSISSLTSFHSEI
jgi:hypothetical protein